MSDMDDEAVWSDVEKEQETHEGLGEDEVHMA